MGKHSTPFLLAVCASLLLSSCFSPRPVVRVEPTIEASKWNYGQAILEAEQDSIIVNAAFAYSDKDYLVFDVEVINWREDRILVNPAGIFLEASPGKYKIFAVDPEKQMLDLELDASRREANAKNAAVIAGVATVAAATAIIATAGNNDNPNVDGFEGNGSDFVTIAPTVIIGTGAGAPPPDGPHKEDPWFWADHTLRKTTLENGHLMKGKVLFPRDNQLSGFELLVPVEDLIFSFGFNQRLFQP